MNFTSQRGGAQKSLDGFIYRLDKSLKNGMESWRCIKKHCKGRIYLINGKLDHQEEHNHEPNFVETEVKQYLSTIREKALTSKGAAKDLIEQDLAALSPEALGKLPKFSSTQRMIERKRKSISSNASKNSGEGAETRSVQRRSSHSVTSLPKNVEIKTPETSSSKKSQETGEGVDLPAANENDSPTPKRKRSESVEQETKKPSSNVEELPRINMKDANCDDLFLASLSKEFRQIKSEETKLDLKILILQLVRSAIHGNRGEPCLEDYQDDIRTPTGL